MQKGGAVYILTSQKNTVLYTGVTSDLAGRMIEHIERLYPKSFTARYNVTKLVYYELFHSIEEAIDREKQIKAGSRKKKIELIESFNPSWQDMYEKVKHW